MHFQYNDRDASFKFKLYEKSNHNTRLWGQKWPVSIEEFSESKFDINIYGN